jgi:hydrogenase maturation factor
VTCEDGHCITCADDGAPMRVLRVRDDALALCGDDAGAHHTVELALVEAGVGDQVLVHAGVALVTL